MDCLLVCSEIFSRLPFYCRWIEETTRGEVKCQPELPGEQPSPLPKMPPIEEITDRDARCHSENGGETPLSTRGYPREKLVVGHPDRSYLALYRDNGTKACYSRSEVRMCLGDSRPRN